MMPAGERTRISRFGRALLLSPAVILFASATRLLVVSNYDSSTAVTIAANSGVAGTLLGTLVPLLPPFLPGLVGVLIIVRRYALAALAAGATAVISPAYMTLGSAWRNSRHLSGDAWNLTKNHDWPALWHDHRWATAVAATSGLIALIDPPRWMTRAWHAFREKYQPQSSPYRFRRKYVEPTFATVELLWMATYRLLFAGLMVIVATFSFYYLHSIYQVPRNMATLSDIMRRPWVSLEQIDSDDASGRHVGYTISTKDGWHLILEEDSRTIAYIKAAKVKSRNICVLSRAEEVPRPLVRLPGAHYVQIPICNGTPTEP